ncbi:MAG: hypothetical protein IKZ00_00330 [Bacteroidaceae bacterium]|nr:hypothetical protein [Bacteroidaceae bacterium]
MKATVSVKFDRRRKYYVILDCETATLPCAHDLPENLKKQVAIAKPLIYDLGWTIVDKKGNIYARENYLISEIFSVPSIFDTAYYASKRPLYLEKLERGEITLTDWRTASARLEKALEVGEAVGAYNAMFDYKKAIPFTELYINQLYSPDFHKWLKFQNECCERIINKTQIGNSKEFDPDFFRFRGKEYPMFDLWGLSCEYLLNNDEYKKACLQNGWRTESGKYFKTSAETTYRFITGNIEFDESHTAIDDADIESEIFAMIVKKAKNKVDIGIEYFPFRKLGTVERFVETCPNLDYMAKLNYLLG